MSPPHLGAHADPTAHRAGYERAAGAGAVTTGRSPPHLVTLVLIAGGAVMAMNIFLPVLPQIARELNTTPAMAQQVLTLFLATTAFAQLFIGPMSDRFGRRPVLLATTAMFVLATIVCLLATSIEMLLVGRVLQASTAASIALSRAIVRDLYDRSKAASMIGYVTMAMAVIPMLSPAIGGYVGEAVGWRGPFWVLLFVAMGLFVLIWFDLGETHQPQPGQGVRAQVRDYLTLLREPAVWGFVATSTLASGAYFAFLGGAPFVGGEVIGMSAGAIGTNFMFVALGYIMGNFLSGRYSERIGIEPMMLYGGLVAALGVGISLSLMLAFEPRAAFLFWPMTLVGMGNGMTLPNANAGVVSVRPHLAGSASGIAGAMQIGGGAALATLAGHLISVENGGLPLFVIMFGSSVLGAMVALVMWLRAG